MQCGFAFSHGLQPSELKASGWSGVTRQPCRPPESMLLKLSGLGNGRKFKKKNFLSVCGCWYETSVAVAESHWQLTEDPLSLSSPSKLWTVWTSVGMYLWIINWQRKLSSLDPSQKTQTRLRIWAAPHRHTWNQALPPAEPQRGETWCTCCLTG